MLKKENISTVIGSCYSIFWLLCLFLCLFVFHLNGIHYSAGQNLPTQKEAKPLTLDEDPLRFVPQSTRHVWDKRDFLVIFGFPSLDIPVRRWRRHMQRITCWNFPEVATLENNYTGAMLVLYLLAKHLANNFVLSDTLVEEAAQWHDIVIHPMNEGKSSTKKILSDNGYWGVEAEVGSSRKTFYWFQFALLQFPRAPYFAKGDDDSFLSVPQYLADLRRLPRKRIYWGQHIFKKMRINEKGDTVKVRYMLGYCFTLARDAAEALVSYKPMQGLVALPYSEKTEPEFIAMNMQYEDVMVGRVLQEVGFPVIYFIEGSFRFHAHTTFPVSDMIVTTHKPKEYEYYELVNRVMINKRPRNATRIIKKRRNRYYMDAPL